MNPTVNILGVEVSAINLKMATDTIDEWIRRREARYVCVTGVHGLMESYRNPAIKRVHNAAGMVTPDGMPLVWLSRVMGFRHVGRVYGPDLMLAICQNSIRTGYRHFFYGGAAGIPEKLAGNLANRFQGLDVTGTYSPPFRPLSRDEDESIIRAINETQSDIVWVGMSTPKQEVWMAEHVGKILAPVMIGVGAAFDFHAGVKKQAPVWMQRSGYEWLFRLSQEPRRLWRRYLICNFMFVTLLVLNVFRPVSHLMISHNGLSR
jgi:N-acetylglucosaminyldiphosphoundecaprenol N-acetyl-beta-D-mannosaminyltransferase